MAVVTNIWHEPAEGIILSAEGLPRIRRCTLNHLILTITREDLVDYGDTDVFLLTYREYSNKNEVLQKLTERYQVPEREKDEKKILAIKMRVINLICAWIEQFPRDFTPEFIISVQNFAATLPKQHSAIIQQALKAQLPYIAKTVKISKISTLSSGINVFELTSTEFARQLTLVDFELYSRLEAEEFVGMYWQPRHANRTARIHALIDRFNSVHSWVRDSILQLETPKERAKRMTWFIDVANSLLTIQNFNTHLSITAGLNAATVTRLKTTRAELSPATVALFDEISQVGSAHAGYRTLRQAHASAPLPCMYYIGILLTDLTFIHEGNLSLVGGLINFDKYKHTHQIAAKIIPSTKVPFPFEMDHQIAHLLRNIGPIMDEEASFKLSLEREPRRPRSKK